MAKRHFEDYYNKIYVQYLEMLDSLSDFEQACMQGVIEPERFEEFKKALQPIKDSYNTLSYVKYLLDMPNRKSKESSYKSRNKKLLKSLDNTKSPESIQKINKNKLDELKKEV